MRVFALEKRDLERLGDFTKEAVPRPYYYHMGIEEKAREAYLRDQVAGWVAKEGTLALAVEHAGHIVAAGVVEPLAWDSEQLGVDAGRCSFAYVPGWQEDQRLAAGALVSALYKAAREAGLMFLFSKVPADAFPLVHAMEDAGFRIMDCELTFTYSGRLNAEPLAEDDIRVEVVRGRAVPGLNRLASIFQIGRFAADSRIDPETCEALWRTSIDNCCLGFAESVIVAFCGDTPVGFISLRDDPRAARTFKKAVKAMFLVGVSPKHAGRGIGGRLIRAVLESLSPAEVHLEVETQSHNLGAVALYSKNGFRLAASHYAMHAWLD